jgi:ribosomal protein L29
MTIKKQQLQELRNSGKASMLAKVKALQLELATAKINRYKAGESKNPRETRTIRRAIAQLNTFIGSIKE